MQEFRLERERYRREHDRDVWAAWYGERFARVERLGLPNDYLLSKVSPGPGGRPRPQSIADMKAALNLISRAVNQR